jgi:hypothetical protein
MLDTAPVAEATSSLNDLTHFVCSCQLDRDGLPITLPVIAFCGTDCHEEEPAYGGPPCKVCCETMVAIGCPSCRAGR